MKVASAFSILAVVSASGKGSGKSSSADEDCQYNKDLTEMHNVNRCMLGLPFLKPSVALQKETAPWAEQLLDKAEKIWQKPEEWIEKALQVEGFPLTTQRAIVRRFQGDQVPDTQEIVDSWFEEGDSKCMAGSCTYVGCTSWITVANDDPHQTRYLAIVCDYGSTKGQSPVTTTAGPTTTTATTASPSTTVATTASPSTTVATTASPTTTVATTASPTTTPSPPQPVPPVLYQGTVKDRKDCEAEVAKMRPYTPCPYKPLQVKISYCPKGPCPPLAALSQQTGDPDCSNPEKYRLVFSKQSELVLLAMKPDDTPCHGAYANYTPADLTWHQGKGGMWNKDIDSSGPKVCLKMDMDFQLKTNDQSNLVSPCTEANREGEGGVWNFQQEDVGNNGVLCMRDVNVQGQVVPLDKDLHGTKTAGDCSPKWQWEQLTVQELQASPPQKKKPTCKQCLREKGSFSCATAESGCILTPGRGECTAQLGDWCSLDYPLCASGHDDWMSASASSPRRECKAGCTPAICEKKMHEQPENTAINKCYTLAQIGSDGSLQNSTPHGCNYGSEANTCAYDDSDPPRCVYSDIGSMVIV